MGVPHITSFCWCMGLEVGAKCVGFVHLLVSFILMILCSVFAENVRGFVGTAEDAGDGLYATWYKIAVATAVVTVVHVLLAFTLLFSVFKRAARGVRVWVWVMSALCAASLVCIVVYIVCIVGTARGARCPRVGVGDVCAVRGVARVYRGVYSMYRWHSARRAVSACGCG
ncbi:uncharacterized protein LOC111356440 isoform X1 [Spodoptera litura]|uniref:Uncharacterized protein LOC111356440 isoform X1 n=1 Tax=Spodoptera litura TaxID=69820 RepID=A0A9J7ISN9_SPOLT|nr:uncharacterized protein LOC111356440 isoform X1 [Spodoptera litura]